MDPHEQQGTGGHDLVVVGASAGGVEALRTLVAALPADLPACVLVVLHLPRGGPASVLPDILQRVSALPVRAAQHGEPLEPGVVLVAPVDRHLLVEDGHVALSRGPRENGHRPAIDATFRAAAHAWGSRVVGAVLTGNLDDGSAGLLAVTRHGGAALVQDPDDAAFPGMPANAAAAVPGASVLPLDALAAELVSLVRTPAPARLELEEGLASRERGEVEAVRGRQLGAADDDHPGTPSSFSCPDCSGVLYAVDDDTLQRYRCRVGHSWGLEGLVERQDRAVETALWVAVRTLEENTAMARRLAETAERSGRRYSGRHFAARAEESAQHARMLRQLLAEGATGNGSRTFDETLAPDGRPAAG